jgi:hypothetical protein
VSDLELAGRVVGCDLARADDFTVAIVVDVVRHLAQADGSRPLDEYAVVHQTRMRHQPWPVIADRLSEMAGWAALRGAQWVVDSTGVGAPIVDLLRPRIARLTALTITSGIDASQLSPGEQHVPKVALLSNLELLVQSHRLSVDPLVRDAEVLRRELSNYTYEITPSGRMTSGAAGSGHDDSVLALAVGLWVATASARGTAAAWAAFYRRQLAEATRPPSAAPLQLTAAQRLRATRDQQFRDQHPDRHVGWGAP